MKWIAQSAFTTLLICLAAFASPGLGQDKSLKKIAWGQTSISSSQWIPWIAKDAKLYEKNGLDVDIVLPAVGAGDVIRILVEAMIEEVTTLAGAPAMPRCPASPTTRCSSCCPRWNGSDAGAPATMS